MDELHKLSRYIYRMLSIEDYLEFAKEVYIEAAETDPKAYPEEFINSELADIKELLNEYGKRDLFEEYKGYQKQYINSLKNNRIDVYDYQVKN